VKLRFLIAALLAFFILAAAADARPQVMRWKVAYNFSLRQVKVTQHERPNANQSGVFSCARRTPLWVDCSTWIAGTMAVGYYYEAPLYEHFFCPETYVVRRLPRTFKFYFLGGGNLKCEHFIDTSPTVTPVSTGKGAAMLLGAHPRSPLLAPRRRLPPSGAAQVAESDPVR
jgi:hypothetical protein